MKKYFFAAGLLAISACLIFLSVANAGTDKGGNPRRDCISAISEK